MHARLCLYLLIILLLCSLVGLLHAASRFQHDPKLTIVFTNDTLGLLEPCGCAEGMLGGLPRRATLLKQLRQEDPKLLLFDSGNILGPDSDTFKAELLPKAYRRLGYQAAILGPEDIPYQKLLRQGMQKQRVAGSSSKTTELFTSIYQVRGIRVGILGLPYSGIKLTEGQYLTKLQQSLIRLDRQSDIIVLLSSLGRKRDEQLARRGLAGDVLIGNQQWQTLKKPVKLGKTWILPTSQRGEHLSRVELTRSGQVWQPSWRRFPLDEKVANDLAMQRLLNTYYDQVSQKLLSQKGEGGAKVSYGVASACSFCHRGPTRIWKKSKHAQAMRTLKKKQRHQVPECLACHSEYYRRTKTAPTNLTKHAVECASCHGDGIMLILRPRQLSKAARPDEKVCRGCHTPEKSPKFDFKKYKARIKHWK